MAIYRISELRELSDVDIEKKLKELNLALLEAGNENPKKNREIKRTIAKIKTIQNERKNA